jgi:hypothetical protein
MGFFMRARSREAPVGSYPTFSPLPASLVVSGRLSVVSQISSEARANKAIWRLGFQLLFCFPYWQLTTDYWQLMMRAVYFL